LARLMSPVDQSPRSKYVHSSNVVNRNGHENHHGSPLMRPGGVDILNSPPMRGPQRDGPRSIRDNNDTVTSVASSSARNGHPSPITERESGGSVDKLGRHKLHGPPIPDSTRAVRNGHDAHTTAMMHGYARKSPPPLGSGIDLDGPRAVRNGHEAHSSPPTRGYSTNSPPSLAPSIDLDGARAIRNVHEAHTSPVIRNGYSPPTGIDAPPIRKLMLSPGKP
jgi:hypothetical protein